MYMYTRDDSNFDGPVGSCEWIWFLRNLVGIIFAVRTVFMAIHIVYILRGEEGVVEYNKIIG